MASDEEKEMMLAVGAALKKLREDKGLSQRDVLYDTGILVSRIESSEKSITLYTLLRLCNYFQITLQEFFTKYY